MDLTPDDIEGYRIDERLREADHVVTYRGERLEDGRPVAVKTFSLGDAPDWKTVELFDRQVRVLTELDHARIPEVLDSFEDDQRGERILVQEFVEGKTLADWIEGGWHPDEDDAIDLANQVLRILRYLHGRSPPIIHRDIKPQNLIGNDQGEWHLIDFGAIRTDPREEGADPGTVVGTFGYMAPEQLRGHADPASDLFGLGATIVYAITGRSPSDLPYEGLTLEFREASSVGERFASWLDRMVAPEIDERFASAERAQQELPVGRASLDLTGVPESTSAEPTGEEPEADGGGVAEATEPTSADSADPASAPTPRPAEESVPRAELPALPAGHHIEVDRSADELVVQLGPARDRVVGRLIGGGVFGVFACLVMFAVPKTSFCLVPSLILLVFNPAFIPAWVRAGGREQLRIGDVYVELQAEVMGFQTEDTVLNSVDHVDLMREDDGEAGAVRIWCGTESYDVAGHLSPPERRWVHDVLEMYLDDPRKLTGPSAS